MLSALRTLEDMASTGDKEQFQSGTTNETLNAELAAEQLNPMQEVSSTTRRTIQSKTCCDSYEEVKCANCKKWMLVKPGLQDFISSRGIPLTKGKEFCTSDCAYSFSFRSEDDSRRVPEVEKFHHYAAIVVHKNGRARVKKRDLAKESYYLKQWVTLEPTADELKKKLLGTKDKQEELSGGIRIPRVINPGC